MRLFSPGVGARVRRHVGNAEDARELVDDILVAVLIALRKGAVRETDRLEHFVHGTTAKLLKNYYRRKYRTPRMERLSEELLGPDTVSAYERAEQLRICRQAAAKLGPTDRKILHLTLVKGMRSGEIATQLALSKDVVRQRKTRAVQHLKEAVRRAAYGSPLPARFLRSVPRWIARARRKVPYLGTRAFRSAPAENPSQGAVSSPENDDGPDGEDGQG